MIFFPLKFEPKPLDVVALDNDLSCISLSSFSELLLSYLLLEYTPHYFPISMSGITISCSTLLTHKYMSSLLILVRIHTDTQNRFCLLGFF